FVYTTASTVSIFCVSGLPYLIVASENTPLLQAPSARQHRIRRVGFISSLFLSIRSIEKRKKLAARRDGKTAAPASCTCPVSSCLRQETRMPAACSSELQRVW